MSLKSDNEKENMNIVLKTNYYEVNTITSREDEENTFI